VSILSKKLKNGQNRKNITFSRPHLSLEIFLLFSTVYQLKLIASLENRLGALILPAKFRGLKKFRCEKIVIRTTGINFLIAFLLYQISVFLNCGIMEFYI